MLANLSRSLDATMLARFRPGFAWVEVYSVPLPNLGLSCHSLLNPNNCLRATLEELSWLTVTTTFCPGSVPIKAKEEGYFPDWLHCSVILNQVLKDVLLSEVALSG